MKHLKLQEGKAQMRKGDTLIKNDYIYKMLYPWSMSADQPNYTMKTVVA